MWTISMLKENAKSALKSYYWLAVVASLIVMILTGGFSSAMSSNSSSDTEEFYDELAEYIGSQNDDYVDYDEDGGITFDTYVEGAAVSAKTGAAINAETVSVIENSTDVLDAVFGAVMGVIVVVFLIALILGFAYSAFVALPLTVGQNRFYLDARAGDAKIGKIFSQFKGGVYMNTVKAMLIYEVKIFLWTLLLIIPGVIKSYEYYLVPYIIAENPNIDRNRAFEISSQTMNGEKMNLFILQLSFIGWNFLGSITFGLGMIFINPYQYATFAEFYSCMREKALQTGIASDTELCGGFGEVFIYDPIPGQYPQNGYNQNSYPQGGYQSNSYQPVNQGSEQQSGYRPVYPSGSQSSSMDGIGSTGSDQAPPPPPKPTYDANASMDEIDFGALGIGNDNDDTDDYSGPEIK